MSLPVQLISSFFLPTGANPFTNSNPLAATASLPAFFDGKKASCNSLSLALSLEIISLASDVNKISLSAILRRAVKCCGYSSW